MTNQELNLIEAQILFDVSNSKPFTAKKEPHQEITISQAKDGPAENAYNKSETNNTKNNWANNQNSNVTWQRSTQHEKNKIPFNNINKYDPKNNKNFEEINDKISSAKNTINNQNLVQATNNQNALKALANATPTSSTLTDQPNNVAKETLKSAADQIAERNRIDKIETDKKNQEIWEDIQAKKANGTSVGQQQQQKEEEIEPTTSGIHNKNMNEIKELNLENNAKAIENSGAITTKEEKDTLKESKRLTKDIDTMYKKGRKSGILSKLNPFNGYVGLGKTGMFAGAALGAIMQHKKNMDKWRAQAQYNAMIGLPPPPKPGLVGSLAWGALKGGVTGAVVGNVVKNTVGKGLHNSMIQSQKNDMVQSEEYQDMVNKAKTNAGVLQNIINQGQSRPDLQQKVGNILAQAGDKGLTQENAEYITNNPGLANRLGIQTNIWNNIPNTKIPGVSRAVKWGKQAHLMGTYGPQNFNMHDYLMDLYETNKYLYQCFSIAEDLEENAVLEMEELTELYNAYATLHEPDNNVSLKAFLDECLIFPNTFVPYVRELVITNKKINYLDNLDTLNELNFSEIQVAPSLVDDFREESKKYQKYCDMYQLYKEHLNPTVDEQTFITRCRNYPSYYDYVKEKISYNLIYKVDQVAYEFFAKTAGGDNIGTTQMPENVKIEGAPGNQEVIDNALANGQDPETADTQNQLSARKGVKQQEVVDAQKEQNDQNQIAEKEAMAKQTIENAKAKANAKQQKTVAKRQQVTKKLNAEGKDYPPEVLAQKRQEITNLNLKEQQIKANLNAKINQANDKLEEFKNKKESK